MKAEIISATVVRVTGRSAKASVRKKLQRFKISNDVFHVPPNEADLLKKLVPEPLRQLASRKQMLSYEHRVQVSDTLWNSLFDYQKKGVQEIVHRFHGRCLLADEMGLGKTRQALAVISHYNVKSIVLCPAFLQANWHHELARFQLHAKVCSFNSFRPTSQDEQLVIVDEAHYLKSRTSARAQLILPLLLRARRVVLLSGTPCPNRPEELFNLLHALRPRLVPNFVDFAKRYCNPRKSLFNHFDTRGNDRKDELKWLLQRAFWIRRFKTEELPGLPEKLTKEFYVASEPEYIKKLQDLHAEMTSALSKGSKLAQTLMSRMYQETAHAKLNSATDLVHHLVSAETPAVVFAHHRVMLDRMQELLSQKLRVCRIDGSVPLQARHEAVCAFQNGDFDVAVLSMAAAGVGLTLTRACTAFFLEIPWCPAVLRQCEDRIHRIGQQKKCSICYVLCHDTLDSYVWKTIHRKESVASRIGQ